MAFRNLLALSLSVLVAVPLPTLAALPAEKPEASPASRPASLFDPDRHLRVADVRPGMKGYGLTVFSGTTIQRFEIEVIDTVRNFGPGFDAVLIMAKGDFLQHTGSVAGMSGSPIYLTCPDGKDRLLGAFAFGWNNAKDPIAGVQPIEYMLQVADPALRRDAVRAADAPPLSLTTPSSSPEPSARGLSRLSWNYFDVIPLPKRPVPATFPLASRQGLSPNPAFASGLSAAPSRVSSLAFTSSGLSPRLLADFSPVLSAYGVSTIQPAASAPAASTRPAATIVPGASLVVPVMSGDVELAAIGTCTEVIGDRVFGFGHPFNSEGGVELPMAAGYINTVVAALNSSFKLGAATEVLGAIRADTTVGVSGMLGATARTIPVSVRIVYSDGSLDRTLRFRIARHPRFTPLLTVLSAQAALAGVSDLPEQYTLNFQSSLRFESYGEEIRLANVLSGGEGSELFFALASPVIAAIQNPYGRSYPTSIDTTLTVVPGTRTAEVVSATTSKHTCKPGDTLRIHAALRVHRTGTREIPVDLKLPLDLEPGDYTVVLSGFERFQSDDAEQQPHLYHADSLPEVFQTILAATRLRNDNLYVRLARPAGGLSLGRTVLNKLPGSRQQLLTRSAGPSQVAPVSTPVVISVPTGFVLTGEAEISLTVEPLPGQSARPASPGSTSKP